MLRAVTHTTRCACICLLFWTVSRASEPIFNIILNQENTRGVCEILHISVYLWLSGWLGMKRIVYFVRFLQFSNQACCGCTAILSLVIWSSQDFHFISGWFPRFWAYRQLFAFPHNASLFLLALLPCFLLLPKCSFQFHFFCSWWSFVWHSHQLPFRCPPIESCVDWCWVHQILTGDPSWSNCQFLATPVWEHSCHDLLYSHVANWSQVLTWWKQLWMCT